MRFYLAINIKVFPRKTETMYLGPKYSNEEIIKQLKKAKVNFQNSKSEKFVAHKLNEGYSNVSGVEWNLDPDLWEIEVYWLMQKVNQ